MKRLLSVSTDALTSNHCGMPLLDRPAGSRGSGQDHGIAHPPDPLHPDSEWSQFGIYLVDMLPEELERRVIKHLLQSR